MARKLGQRINTATFVDNLNDGEGDGKIVLHYRLPTTMERAAYTNQSFQRQGDELVSLRGDARMEAGLQIITGFRFGDFLDGDDKPFASEPEHPAYRENWKELLMDGGSDLVELLAIRVFDMPCAVAPAVKKAPAKAEPPEASVSGN